MFDYFFPKKVIENNQRKQDAFDKHLELTAEIENLYKQRDTDPHALQKAIDCCWEQIALAEKAKKAWLKECVFMPRHKGYTRLCIFFEKEKQFAKAIEMAEQAKAQGWNGDWDKRIERCRSKLLRHQD